MVVPGFVRVTGPRRANGTWPGVVVVPAWEPEAHWRDEGDVDVLSANENEPVVGFIYPAASVGWAKVVTPQAQGQIQKAIGAHMERLRRGDTTPGFRHQSLPDRPENPECIQCSDTGFRAMTEAGPAFPCNCPAGKKVAP